MSKKPNEVIQNLRSRRVKKKQEWPLHLDARLLLTFTQTILVLWWNGKKTLRTIFWRECKDLPQELSTSSIKERLAELVEIGGEMLKV